MSQSLFIDEVILQQLRQLRAEPKFHEHMPGFYPGAPNEEVRCRCERQLNALVDRLTVGLPAHATKQYVLEEFRTTLTAFETEDSEECDRLLGYLEQIMDITGIESSDGLLNEWRYGFDPTKPPQMR
jgi:Domain of unknown function (DUF4844)